MTTWAQGVQRPAARSQNRVRPRVRSTDRARSTTSRWVRGLAATALVCGLAAWVATTAPAAAAPGAPTTGQQNASGPAATTAPPASAATPDAISTVAVAAAPAAGAAASPAVPVAASPATAGAISTVAGSDVPGPAPATSVALDPSGVAVAGGNVYVADATHGVVREVSSTASETVVAGDGSLGDSGDGGPATAAALVPGSLAVDPSSGNLVVADPTADVVRVVAGSTGTFYGLAMTAGDIYTVAGDGTYGYAGDGGSARSAELGGPAAVAVDRSGNLVIADTGNNRVRVVAGSTGAFYGVPMVEGDIYTVAGDGTPGYSGDGGPATSAELQRPRGVAVDSSGNLVIADTGNDVVRVVAGSTGTSYGIAMAGGDIYGLAGNGTPGYSGDAAPATAAELDDPASVAVGPSGNVVVSDSGNDVVRVVAGSNGTSYGVAMTAGDIYTVAGNGTSGYSGDGGPATAAELDDPGGVAVGSSGDLVVADTDNARVRVVAASTGTSYGIAVTAGDISTVAGNGTPGYSGEGGPATSAQLLSPRSVAVGSSGNVAVADTGDDVVRVVVASTGTSYGIAMTAGEISTVAGNGTSGYSGDGGPATAAELDDPVGVAVGPSGNLAIADSGNDVVRMVANTTGTFYGVAMTAGDIYSVAGDGTSGYSGDGGPATAAELDDPVGVAVDSAGNLVVADSGNDVVRVVAGTTGTFYGVAMTAGDIYSVAGDGTSGYSGDGGPATAAELDDPVGVAVDSAGNLVVADSGNDVVRVVARATGTFYGAAMSAGEISTVAGNGTSGYSGDGGPATAAELDDPVGVAVDSAGNLVVADSGNDVVRVVARATGTFYGVAMSAGEISTVAGTGAAGYAGDGGPATAAELDDPSAVASGASGELFVADTSDGRIREVAPAEQCPAGSSSATGAAGCTAGSSPSYGGSTPLGASSSTGSLTDTVPGQVAIGFGSYTLAGLGPTAVAFAVTPASSTNDGYLATVEVTTPGQWWFLSSNVTSFVRAGTEGLVGGTGDLSFWAPTADGGRGAWSPAELGVSYQATFEAASGSAPASFGIAINYTPVAPQPSVPPSTPPVVLEGGAVLLG